MADQICKVNPKLHGFLVPVGELREDDMNPVTHDQRNLDAMRRSLEAYGQQKPVVHRGGMVLAGNGLLRSAMAMGWTHVAAVESDLDDDAAMAGYKIADNKTSDLHAWDWGATGKLLEELKAADFDLLATGFDEDKINELLPQSEPDAPSPQIDRAAELQAEWGTKLGQLWEIPGKAGVHRLLCGDSTKAEDVERVMGGQQTKLLVTSPPYWVGKEYEAEKTWNEVQSFVNRCALAWPAVCSHRIVINTGAPQAAHLTGKPAHIRLLLDEWQREFGTVGLLLRYARIWTKSGGLCHTKPESDCIDQHWEFIGMFYRPETYEGQRRCGEPWATNGIWNDIPGTAQREHSAPFHLEVPSRNIRLHSDPSDVILDPFLGSGTTMVAAEQLGRVCRGIDIEPKYVAVALQRMKDMGLSPKLAEGAPVK